MPSRLTPGFRGVKKEFTIARSQFKGTTSLELSQLFSNVTNQVFTEFNPTFTSSITDAQDAIYKIGNSTFNSTEQLQDISTLFAVVQNSLFSNFEIEPPESTAMVDDPNDEWSKNEHIFTLVVRSPQDLNIHPS